MKWYVVIEGLKMYKFYFYGGGSGGGGGGGK